jgi:hypothetical protein
MIRSLTPARRLHTTVPRFWVLWLHAHLGASPKLTREIWRLMWSPISVDCSPDSFPLQSVTTIFPEDASSWESLQLLRFSHRDTLTVSFGFAAAANPITTRVLRD